jgi:hypothetical protein
MHHLLTAKNFDQVIFIDPDVCFFSDPSFLFDEMSGASVLLSPHWRSSDPLADPVNFELNFKDGIYNGGCIGATQKGIPALEWLARACLYKCENGPGSGLFADQKYLDLLQSRFPDVQVIQHKGCNVANWNMIDCKRMAFGEGVRINGTDPIVFIHFSKSTIRGILSGKDALLLPYLEEYISLLKECNPSFPGFVMEQKQPAQKGHFVKRAIRGFIQRNK